jgi:PAS domain S-box-containing protein
MIAVDPEGLIRSWNAGARRIFGYGRNEMLGTPLSRLLPPQDQRGMSRLLSRIRRHPWIEYREKTCLKKGAHRIDVAFAAIPEQSLFPDRGGVLLVVHDISARKKIERAVAERFESTERLARVGSWELNVATGTLAWSEEFGEMLGLDPSQRQSTLRRHLRRVRPADRKSFIGAIRKTLRDHVPFESRHGLRRDDGTILAVLSRGRLIAGPGPLTRIVGITQDLRDTPEGLVPVLEAHFRKLKSVQQHALLLSRAALALFSGFDHEKALLRTVKAVVPGLADRCIIDLIEKKERVLRFRASRMGPGGRTLPAWVERLELRRFPPGPTARVLRTGSY